MKRLLAFALASTFLTGWATTLQKESVPVVLGTRHKDIVLQDTPNTHWVYEALASCEKSSLASPWDMQGPRPYSRGDIADAVAIYAISMNSFAAQVMPKGRKWSMIAPHVWETGKDRDEQTLRVLKVEPLLEQLAAYLAEDMPSFVDSSRLIRYLRADKRALKAAFRAQVR